MAADDTFICGNCSAAFSSLQSFVGHKNSQVNDGNTIICTATDKTIAKFSDVVFVVEDNTNASEKIGTPVKSPTVKKRGRPRKLPSDVKPDRPIVEEKTPILGDGGSIGCNKCGRVFIRLRHFTSHKCLHEDYVDYTKKSSAVPGNKDVIEEHIGDDEDDDLGRDNEEQQRYEDKDFVGPAMKVAGRKRGRPRLSGDNPGRPHAKNRLIMEANDCYVDAGMDVEAHREDEAHVRDGQKDGRGNRVIVTEKSGENVVKRKRGRPRLYCRETPMLSNTGSEVVDVTGAEADKGGTQEGCIKVTLDTGAVTPGRGRKRKTNSPEERLAVFNGEEDKRAFDASLSLDLSHVDHLFNVHMLEQEVNHRASGARAASSALYLYSCKACDKVFKTLSLTRLHVLIHTDLKPFKCPRCEFSSNCKGNLYTHIRRHTGQYYQCKTCPFKSVNRGHVIEHELTHSGLKETCRVCKNVFNTRKSLVAHIRTYHRGTPQGKEYLLSFLAGRQEKGTAIIHQCHVCNRKFKKRADRDRHLFTHDVSESPLIQKCDVCDYTTTRKGYMEKHFLRHRIIYKCSVCSETFLSTIRLIGHLINCHSLEHDAWADLFKQSINASLFLPEISNNDYENGAEIGQTETGDPKENVDLRGLGEVCESASDSLTIDQFISGLLNDVIRDNRTIFEPVTSLQITSSHADQQLVTGSLNDISDLVEQALFEIDSEDIQGTVQLESGIGGPDRGAGSMDCGKFTEAREEGEVKCVDERDGFSHSRGVSAEGDAERQDLNDSAIGGLAEKEDRANLGTGEGSQLSCETGSDETEAPGSGESETPGFGDRREGETVGDEEDKHENDRVINESGMRVGPECDSDLVLKGEGEVCGDSDYSRDDRAGEEVGGALAAGGSGSCAGETSRSVDCIEGELSSGQTITCEKDGETVDEVIKSILDSVVDRTGLDENGDDQRDVEYDSPEKYSEDIDPGTDKTTRNEDFGEQTTGDSRTLNDTQASNPGDETIKDDTSTDGVRHHEEITDVITEKFGYTVSTALDYVPFFKQIEGSNKTNLVEKFGYARLNVEKFRKMREMFGNDECGYCGRLFHFKKEMDNHILTHTGERPYACGQCDYRSNTKGNLQHHIEDQHMNVQFHCDQCGFLASNRLKLWSHKLKHKPGLKTYSCDLCRLSMNTLEDLKGHMADKHPLLSDGKKAVLLKNSEKIRGKIGKASLKCPYCNKVFQRSRTQFQKHLWIHEGIKPYKCQVCAYTCRTSQNLQSHMLRHSADKPFRCPLCDRAFKSQTAMRGHVRSHSAPDLFMCPKCSYTGTQESHLRRHMQIHEVRKRFACQHCDFSANTAAYVKMHYTRQHPGCVFQDSAKPTDISTINKPAYQCVTCNFVFGNLSDMKRHLRSKHDMTPENVTDMLAAHLPQTLDSTLPTHGVLLPSHATQFPTLPTNELFSSSTCVFPVDSSTVLQAGVSLLSPSKAPSVTSSDAITLCIIPNTTEASPTDPSDQSGLNVMEQVMYQENAETGPVTMQAENGELIVVDQTEVIVSTDEGPVNKYVIECVLPELAQSIGDDTVMLEIV